MKFVSVQDLVFFLFIIYVSILKIFLSFLAGSGSLFIFKIGALFYGCKLQPNRALNR